MENVFVVPLRRLVARCKVGTVEDICEMKSHGDSNMVIVMTNVFLAGFNMF